MFTDTSLLPGFDDPAPWDDSGGDQEEKRPGVQDQGDKMESDNDTESNANIIAPDDENSNSNSGENSPATKEIRATNPIDHSIWGARSSVRKPVAKATTEQSFAEWAAEVAEANDEQPTQSNPAVNQSNYGAEWAKRMAGLSKQMRDKASDGWKQHESVPPVGIHDDIKKSDSGIAVREGKEFRQRDEMVLESREMKQTPPPQQEASRKQAVKQDGLDKYYESNWVSGLALEGAARALRTARIQNPTVRCVLMLMAENAHNDFGTYECAMSQSLMAKILGVKQCTVSRAINALVDAKLIRPASSFVPGRKSICYELLFAIRGEK